MAVVDETAIGRFELPDGTQLTLHGRCLVHRGPARLETIPLAALVSVGVSFERDGRRLRWGVALLVMAAVLFAVAQPLGTLSAAAAAEVTLVVSGIPLQLKPERKASVTFR